MKSTKPAALFINQAHSQRGKVAGEKAVKNQADNRARLVSHAVSALMGEQTVGILPPAKTLHATLDIQNLHLL